MTRSQIQEARRLSISIASEGIDKTHYHVLSLVYARLSACKGVGGKYPAYVSTKYIWKYAEEGQALSHGAYPSRLRKLYDMGYLERVRISNPAAAITPKGWALLAALGYVSIDTIRESVRGYEHHEALFTKLYKAAAAYLNLQNVADDGGRLVKQTLETLADKHSAFLENLPFKGEEPLAKEDLEDILLTRSKDPKQVALARDSLSSVWSTHDKARGITTETEALYHDIGKYMSDLDIIKADYTNMRDGPDNFWRRELSVRKSADGGFTPKTLADAADKMDGLGYGHGVRKGRGLALIEEGLEMQRLSAEGHRLGMDPNHTLGDVAMRLERESIAGAAPGGPSVFDAQMEGGPDADPLPVFMEPVEGLPHDLFTHRAPWRRAILHARDTAEPATVDSDDRSYWQHELEAFDRVFLTFQAHGLEDPSKAFETDEPQSLIGGFKFGSESVTFDVVPDGQGPMLFSFLGVIAKLSAEVKYDDAQLGRGPEMLSFCNDLRNFLLEAVNDQFTQFVKDRVIKELTILASYYANPQTWAEADVSQQMGEPARETQRRVQEILAGRFVPHYKDGQTGYIAESMAVPPMPTEEDAVADFIEAEVGRGQFEAALYESIKVVGKLADIKRVGVGWAWPFAVGGALGVGLSGLLMLGVAAIVKLL